MMIDRSDISHLFMNNSTNKKKDLLKATSAYLDRG